MAKVEDVVTIEIKGLERFEAAVDRFARSVEEFGRMAAATTPEVLNLVIKAAEGLSVEEVAEAVAEAMFLATGSSEAGLGDPSGAERCWPVSVRRPYTTERVPLDASTATGDDLRLIADKVNVPHWHYETDDQIRPRVLKAMEASRVRS